MGFVLAKGENETQQEDMLKSDGELTETWLGPNESVQIDLGKKLEPKPFINRR